MEDVHRDETSKVAGGDRTAKDPVCGMTVSIGSDTRHAEFQGNTFYFCSEKCQTKFKADPSIYASGHDVAPKKPAPADAQYTCPMHPEIVRDAPGACPICGMALEPVVPTDEPSVELTDFTRRMWISAAAAVPLIVLTMGPMVGFPVRDWVGHELAGYLEFALATPVVLWAALPVFRRGWDSVVNRSPNMLDTDQPGCVGRLFLFAFCGLSSWHLSGTIPFRARGRNLLRGIRGDRGAGLFWAGAGTAGARTHGKMRSAHCWI